MDNTEISRILNDFRDIEVHLHQVEELIRFNHGPIASQSILINEIVKLARAAQPGDQLMNLKRALTSFIPNQWKP